VDENKPHGLCGKLTIREPKGSVVEFLHIAGSLIVILLVLVVLVGLVRA
jgi:hypothetical protein